MQAGPLRRREKRGRLLQGQRPGRAPLPAAGRIDQRGDVPAHQVLGLRMADGAGQAVVRLLHGAGRVGARHRGQRGAHVGSGQVLQRPRADSGQDRLK